MILKTRTLHVCVCALRNREKGLNTQTAVALQGGKKGICPKAWLQSNSLCLLRCLTWLQRGKPYLNSHKALAGIPWISSPEKHFDKKTQVEVRQNRINQPGGKTVRKEAEKQKHPASSWEYDFSNGLFFNHYHPLGGGAWHWGEPGRNLKFRWHPFSASNKDQHDNLTSDLFVTRSPRHQFLRWVSP